MPRWEPNSDVDQGSQFPPAMLSSAQKANGRARLVGTSMTEAGRRCRSSNTAEGVSGGRVVSELRRSVEVLAAIHRRPAPQGKVWI